MINISPAHSFTYASARINVYHANAKEGLLKHEHLYSHSIMCNAGSCLVTLQGRNYYLTKDSQPLNLPANEWHEIEALKDGTVFVNIFEDGKG